MSLLYRCYCVDTEGRRIFGEALNIRGIGILMKCECSRQEASLGTVLETDMRVPFVRCNEMGSFDQLQCIKDQCLCVDIHSGFATSHVVNITSQGLQTLPCCKNITDLSKTFLKNIRFYR